MTTAIVKVDSTALTVAECAPHLAKYEEQLAGLEAVVSRPTFKVDSQAAADWANYCLHLIAEGQKEVEATRKQIVQPLNAQVDEVNGEFMPRLKRAKQLRDMLADALAEWVKAQEVAKTEAMRAAAQAHLAGDHKGAQLALQVANYAQATAPAGTSMKQVWKAEVTDPSRVPREYCIPDEKLLARMAREAKERPPEIPGVRFYQDTRTIVRTR